MNLLRTGRAAVAILLTCLAVLMLTAAPVPALDADDVPGGDLPVRVKVQENVSVSSITCTAYVSDVKWTRTRIWADGHVGCTGTALRLYVEVELYRLTSEITNKTNEAWDTTIVAATVTNDTCFPGLYQAKTKGSVQPYSSTTYQHSQAESQLAIVTC